MTLEEQVKMLREALEENHPRVASALAHAVRLDVSFVVRDSLTVALESMLAALAATPEPDPTRCKRCGCILANCGHFDAATAEPAATCPLKRGEPGHAFDCEHNPAGRRRAATAELLTKHPCGDCGALRGAAPCENCDRLDAATAEPATFHRPEVESRIDHAQSEQAFSAEPATRPQAAKHATNENGDCPAWCPACRIEREHRATEPTPTYSADDLRKVAEESWDAGYNEAVGRAKGNATLGRGFVVRAIIAKAVGRE